MSTPKPSRDSEPPAPPTKMINASSTAKTLQHQLTEVLYTGVFEFLTTGDAAVLLSCCKAFRSDSELASTALLNGPARKFAGHFLHNCGLDWFSFNLKRHPLGHERQSRDCKREFASRRKLKVSPFGGIEDQYDTKTSNHSSDLLIRLQENSSLGRHLLSVVAAFEKHILSAHPPRRNSVSSYGDFVTAVPVLISVWEHHPEKQNLEPAHEWTREDVRLALNAVQGGLGDRFTEEDPKKAHPTQFGAHWESIQVSGDGKTVVCDLCDKARYIQQRISARETMMFTEDRSELDALSASEAGQRFAFCDEVVDRDTLTGYAAGETIMSSKVVAMVPNQDEPGWSELYIPDMVDEQYGFPELCRVYAQPLKQSLLTAFKFANRVRYDLERKKGLLFDDFHQVKVELLAGVSASGYLCGSFFIYNEA